MGRNRDYTGVPNTCPLIDEVIQFIDNVPFEGDDEEKQQFDMECLSIKASLEEIRTRNGNLRAFAIQKQKEAEELKLEIEALNAYIEKLAECN